MLRRVDLNDIVFVALCAAMVVASSVVVAHGSPQMVLVFAGGALVLLAGVLGTIRVASLTASLVLVGAAVVVLPANGVRPIPGASLADLLLVAAAVTAVLGMLSRPSLLPTIPVWVLGGAACLLSAACIAELYQPVLRPVSPVFESFNVTTGLQNEGNNFASAAQLTFAAVVVPVVIAATATSWPRLRLLATVWTIGATASALVAILAAFTPIDLQPILTGADFGIEGGYSEASRVAGLTVHPTTLGLASAMAIPIVIARLHHPNYIFRLLNFAAAGILVLAILVSGTRAGVFAAIAGMLHMFVMQPQARRPLLAFLALGALVAYFRSQSFTQLSIFERFTGAVSSGSSDTGHALVLRESVSLWQQAPLSGWGFDVMRGAHNIVLQMLMAGGPVALAGFAALTIGAWLTARALRKDADIPEDVRHLTTAFAASLLVWFVAALVQSTSSDRYLYLPVAMILAVLFAKQRLARASQGRHTAARAGDRASDRVRRADNRRGARDREPSALQLPGDQPAAVSGQQPQARRSPTDIR